MSEFNALVVDPGYADMSVEADAMARFGLSLGRVAADRLDHDALAQTRILFVRDARVDAGAIASAPNLAGIIRYGVGTDTVDLEAARARKVAVANVPSYGADIDVADQVLALYLAVARRIVSGDRAVRAGRWGSGSDAPIRRIAGSTLGVIGYGRIGAAVHRRFTGFGIDTVYAHDPYLSAAAADAAGVRQAPIEGVASLADILVVCAPGNPDGRPFVDANILQRMKPNAILVNASRGSNVDDRALARALSEGKLAGAGLDVLSQEPPPADHPILALDNVVLSDHVGWYSQEGQQSLQRQAAEQAEQILSGERPKNWVNPW